MIAYFKIRTTPFAAGKIQRSMKNATFKALNEFGRLVRKRVQKSLKYAKDASPPGHPPHVHKSGMITRRVSKATGKTRSRAASPLREFIIWAVEKHRENVVIGALKTNQIFFGDDGRPVTGTVPGVLEHGGSIKIFEILRHGRWRRADLRSRRRIAEAEQKRMRTVTIAARPFMQPAFDIEIRTAPRLWQNAMRKVA